MTRTDPRIFDYVIVGAGSTGCVLANRLSSDGGLQVALIEAGRDFSPGTEPGAIRDPGARAFMLPHLFWPGLVDEDGERRGPVPQARVVGGGSSINGMHAQRGLPRDYEEWTQLGIQGWGWSDLLPYFKRLENDVDFGGPFHGKDGPIEIRRVPESMWSPLTRALRVALDKRGLPHLKDVNAEGGNCTAPVPLNNSTEARVSTAAAYLTQSVRSRSNLRIFANTEVRRVLLDARRVTGVELKDGGQIRARCVILSAGAIHSPTLLLRSGIGPGNQLRACGIGVVADRLGVGRNLRNHPIFTLTCHIKRAARQHAFRTVRPPVPMIVRYSSHHPGCPESDMVLNLWERTPGPLANDPLGRQLAQLMVIMNKTHSKGEVWLNSSKPDGPPRIQARILSDSRDLQRMVSSFHMVCGMLLEEPLSSLVKHVFIANTALGKPPDALTMKLLQDNRQAQLISTLGALAFDFIPGMHRSLPRKSGREVGSVRAESAERLAELVRQATGVGGHPMGTCRLGAIGDQDAVVDSQCRVIGIEGLRVMDASIFPTPMTAGTNIPAIMVGEKGAELLLQEHGVAPRETVQTPP